METQLTNNPVVKQRSLDEQLAEQGKEEGMQTAVDHADRVIPEWSERAFDMLKAFTREHSGEFICENMRRWAYGRGLSTPPIDRAWGAVMLRGAKSGIIRSTGRYEKTVGPTAHRSLASIWEINK